MSSVTFHASLHPCGAQLGGNLIQQSKGFQKQKGNLKKSLEYGMSLKKEKQQNPILFIGFCWFSRLYIDTFRIQGILMKLGTQEVKHCQRHNGPRV